MLYSVDRLRQFLHNVDWRDEPATMMADVRFNFESDAEGAQSLEDVQDGLLLGSGPESLITYLDNNDLNSDNYIKFVVLLHDLQENAQWLITGVSGLENMTKREMKNGTRLGKDGAEISIKIVNGLGNRAKEIKDLYKNTVWDDKYRRWLVPINKRLFSMTISVFDLRIFQDEKVVKRLNAFEGEYEKYSNNDEIDLLPVHTYKCKHCEFSVHGGTKWMAEIDNKEGTDLDEDGFTIIVGDVESTSSYDADLIKDADLRSKMKRETGGIDKMNNTSLWKKPKHDTSLLSSDLKMKSGSRFSSKMQIDTLVSTWVGAANGVVNATKSRFTDENGKFSLDKLKNAAEDLVVKKLQDSLNNLSFADEFKKVNEKMKYLNMLSHGENGYIDFARDLKILKDLFGNGIDIDAATEMIKEAMKDAKTPKNISDNEDLSEKVQEKELEDIDLNDEVNTDLSDRAEPLVDQDKIGLAEAERLAAALAIFEKIKLQNKVDDKQLTDEELKELFVMQVLNDVELREELKEAALLDVELNDNIEDAQLVDVKLDEMPDKKDLKDVDLKADIDYGELADVVLDAEENDKDLVDVELKDDSEDKGLKDIVLKQDDKNVALKDVDLKAKIVNVDLKDVNLDAAEGRKELQDMIFTKDKKIVALTDVFFNSESKESTLKDIKLKDDYVMSSMKDLNLDIDYKQGDLADVKLTEAQAEAVLKDVKFQEAVKEAVMKDIAMDETLKDKDLTKIVMESKYEQGELVDFNLVDKEKDDTKMFDVKFEERQQELKTESVEDVEEDDLAREFAPKDTEFFTGKQVISGAKEQLEEPHNSIRREVGKQNRVRNNGSE